MKNEMKIEKRDQQKIGLKTDLAFILYALKKI